jgi:hypothetical protein
LPALLEQYVSKKMDITTFELTGHQYCDSDSKEIVDTLRPIHPYYKHEYKDIIVRAIGDYFNHLLIYSSYIQRSLDVVYEKEWYVERFTELTASFLRISDAAKRYTDHFYDKYKDKIGANVHDSIEEVFITIGPEKQSAAGFSRELKTQETVRRMLYWILDISVPKVGNLTMPQRTWLYGNIFELSDQSEIKVARHLSFNPADLFRSNQDRSSEAKYRNKMMDMFGPLYVLRGYNDCDNLSIEMLNALNDAVDYAKIISTAKVYEEYAINSLQQLLYLEILSMIRAKTKIRRCKHCGLYFVVPNRKVAYCNRIANGEEKPCSEVGRQKSYEAKLTTDYPLKIYNRAYKTRHARIKHGNMTKNEFIIWRDKAKEKLEQVRSGAVDVPTFETWLRKNYV